MQVKKALKPKLTPEEKAVKAAEMQKKASTLRKQREEKDEVEKVKKARESGKKTGEQMREFQEVERKAFIDNKKRVRYRPFSTCAQPPPPKLSSHCDPRPSARFTPMRPLKHSGDRLSWCRRRRHSIAAC